MDDPTENPVGAEVRVLEPRLGKLLYDSRDRRTFRVQQIMDIHVGIAGCSP